MSAPAHQQLSVRDWLDQARYDLATAELLFDSGRHAYAVFFAHLALEKALKGCYRKTHDRTPPVTHNLRHLAAQSGLPLSDEQRTFLNRLNDASILNFYPDRLFGTDTSYREAEAREVLDSGQELLDWIEMQVERD